MTKVSVLIPTYNMACFLDEAIGSVLGQTFEDFELIVMDNASTDNTEDIVRKYLSDERVQYFKNDSNVGMTKNWNKCLLVANGKYIKFLNADDKLHKDNLYEMTKILDENLDISLVTSWRERFGSESGVFKQKVEKKTEGNEVISLSIVEKNWIGEPTTVMFRKENLYLGFFNINYGWLPDWDMWLRQLSVGHLYVIPSVLSYFRIHEEQMTNYLRQTFSTIFEEYYYSRGVYDFRPFKISDETYNKQLRRTILQIINYIPDIIKNRNIKVLKQAIRIIYSEGYIVYATLMIIKKIVMRILKNITKLFGNGK